MQTEGGQTSIRRRPTPLDHFCRFCVFLAAIAATSANGAHSPFNRHSQQPVALRHAGVPRRMRRPFHGQPSRQKKNRQDERIEMFSLIDCPGELLALRLRLKPPPASCNRTTQHWRRRTNVARRTVKQCRNLHTTAIGAERQTSSDTLESQNMNLTIAHWSEVSMTCLW